MLDVDKVKHLSECTSGVPPVIFQLSVGMYYLQKGYRTVETSAFIVNMSYLQLPGLFVPPFPFCVPAFPAKSKGFSKQPFPCLPIGLVIEVEQKEPWVSVVLYW